MDGGYLSDEELRMGIYPLPACLAGIEDFLGYNWRTNLPLPPSHPAVTPPDAKVEVGLVQADAIAGQAFSPAGQAGRGEERSPVGLFHGKQRLQKLNKALIYTSPAPLRACPAGGKD